MYVPYSPIRMWIKLLLRISIWKCPFLPTDPEKKNSWRESQSYRDVTITGNGRWRSRICRKRRQRATASLYRPSNDGDHIIKMFDSCFLPISWRWTTFTLHRSPRWRALSDFTLGEPVPGHANAEDPIRWVWSVTKPALMADRRAKGST